MKFLFPSALLVFFHFIMIPHPGFGQDTYDIKLKIKNIPDSVAYLGYHFGNQKYVADTSEISENDELVFKGNEPLDQGVYFIYTPKVYFEFIVAEDQMFYIESDTSDLLQMTIKGSPENTLFNQFQNIMSEKQRTLVGLREQLQSATSAEDSTALREKILALQSETESFQNKIVQENEDTYVAKLIQAMQKPEIPESEAEEKRTKIEQFEYVREHYFDDFDLSDPRLLRSPVFHPKVMEYLDQFTYPHPDSIINAVDDILKTASQNPVVYRYLLVTLTNKFETSERMGMDRVFVHLAEEYYLSGKADWANEELLEKFKERVDELKPNLIGNQAPEMNLLTTSLKPIRLKDINADFTILYFYDPDCGHCKKKTPQMLEVYHNLRDKGIEVMGISTVTEIQKWKDFIAKYNLDWINAADPYRKSNFRYEYNISSTPAIYILDQDKKIIAKKLGVGQIEDFINHQLSLN